MKKIFITFLLICVMSMSFAAPAMVTGAVANETVTVEVAVEVGGETTTDTEITVIYHRWCDCGRLQFRVWGVVSMKWLTDWQYM